VEKIVLKPIGYVSQGMPVDKTVKWNRWTDPSTIIINEEYRPGLEGLEEYSHVFIIYFMHVSHPAELKIRPRSRADMPEVGVFASRAPSRPNPIGLTVCKLLEVGEGFLKVVGLDAYTGTPVLDIKPYDYYDVIKQPKVPSWFEKIWVERNNNLSTENP